jgi:hypothetical protein
MLDRRYNAPPRQERMSQNSRMFLMVRMFLPIRARTYVLISVYGTPAVM